MSAEFFDHTRSSDSETNTGSVRRSGQNLDGHRRRIGCRNCGYFLLTQAYRCIKVVSLKLKKGPRGLQILTEAYTDLQTNIA